MKKFVTLFIVGLFGFVLLSFLFFSFGFLNGLFSNLFPLFFVVVFMFAFFGPWLYKGTVKVEGGSIIITDRKNNRTTIPIQAGLKLIKSGSNINGTNINKYVLGIGHNSSDDAVVVSFKSNNERNGFIKDVRGFLNNGVIVEEKSFWGGFKVDGVPSVGRARQMETKQENLKNKLLEKQYAGGHNPVQYEGLKEKIRLVAIIIVIVVGYMVVKRYF